MTYPHYLTITRTTSGTSDGMGGTTGGTTETVYDGEADVQDGGAEVKAEDGVITEEGDATVFLSGSVAGIQVGDDATITWEEGSTQKATVARTIRLDDKLVLSYN